MPAIERAAAIVGVRYLCDTPGCTGEQVSTGNLTMVHPPKHEHVCATCQSSTWLDRTYPTYDIRVQPLGEV